MSDDIQLEYAFAKLRDEMRSSILGKICWMYYGGDKVIKSLFITAYFIGRAVERGEDLTKIDWKSIYNE